MDHRNIPLVDFMSKPLGELQSIVDKIHLSGINALAGLSKQRQNKLRCRHYLFRIEGIVTTSATYELTKRPIEYYY